MKHYVFIILVFILLSCDKNEDNKNVVSSPPELGPSTKILLLVVDYNTYKFEAGKELEISTNTYNSISMPVKVNYNSPGDFGDVTLLYEPTNDSIFGGTIIWMGKGEVFYPRSFNMPDFFEISEPGLNLPPDRRFQQILNTSNAAKYTDLKYENLWKAVHKLKIVKDYFKAGKNIGVYRYQRSVGLGSPSEWDWIIVMTN